MKIKFLITLMFVLLLVPNVLANDETVINTPTTLWATIMNGATYYSANQANISIYLPNTSLLILNQPMTLVSTGVYAYNFSPNVSGIYYTSTVFWNTTSLVATADSTFYVSENAEMVLTILFGLLALIILCFWYARSMANKPITSVNLWIFENVTTKDFSIIFDIVGGFLVIPLLAFLNIIATGSTYAPMFEKLYIVGTYFIGFTLLAYLIFYLMYRYNEGLETLGDIGSGKRR